MLALAYYTIFGLVNQVKHAEAGIVCAVFPVAAGGILVLADNHGEYRSN